MSKKALLIAAVGAVALVSSQARISEHPTQPFRRTDVEVTAESYVVTPSGPVQGVVLSNARVFLGMPYAMPPVGPLRWQPTEAAPAWGPTVWQGIYDPPGCLQTCDSSSQPPHVCPNSFSEDCLFLNVWTPRLSAITEPLPVLIFIHGGAFKDGYAGGIDYGIVYDASTWVNATQAVVVSINYRLGAMGFLYQGGHTSLQGNYGLMDQEMAFRWVQQNIAPFGGDPARITVVGQSAGAMSIASHLSRPAASGLFQGAIMHSEPFALPFRTPATGQDLSNSFAQFGGCSDGSAGANWTQVEACLRGLNATQLIAAEDAAMKSIAANWERIIDVFVPWTPTAGTPYLPVSPLAAFQAGEVLDVPIIMGNVANESNLFINFAFNKSVGDTEYYVLLGVIIGVDHMDAIIEQYPIPSPAPSDYRAQLSTVGSDALFVCPNRNTTASVSLAAGRTSPIYLYFYDHIESFNAAAWGPVYPFDDCWPIVCHGADLVELFHPNYPQYGTNYTAAEDTLTLAIQSYWTNFAATGSPGSGTAGSGLMWPAYNTTDRPVMILQTGGNVIARDNRAELCNFWDSVVGYDFY